MDISIISIISKLFIVLGLIVGCFYLYRLFSNKQQSLLGNNKGMRVKASLVIDQRNKLVVLDLYGEKVMLFIGANSQFVLPSRQLQQRTQHAA